MKKTVLDNALKVRLPITVFVILASFALTYYISRSERDGVGYAPVQPIKFSHKLHAGEMGMDCGYCHTEASKARHAGIPAASTCMNCHSIVRTDSPEIILLKQYFDNNEPIPWKRIHRVPEYAYFNHSVHVNKGIDCANCHGPVGQMDVIRQVQPFTMGACLDCHRNPGKRMPELAGKINFGPENCNACHR